jgi:hypothetical protein
MAHLYTIESHRDERLEPFPTAIRAWMSPDCNGTGRMCDLDGFTNFESLLFNERGFSGAKISIEGFAGILDRATLDQCACNVWTPHRSACGLGHHAFESDRHTDPVELIDDLLRAGLSRSSKHRQAKLERTRIRNVQSEQVNFPRAIIGTELDSGNNSNARSVCGTSCLGNSVESVVISESDCSDTRDLCRGYDFFRRECPVGRRRMHVEVDLAGQRDGRARRGHCV